jgi:hypothetical protein
MQLSVSYSVYFFIADLVLLVADADKKEDCLPP